MKTLLLTLFIVANAYAGDQTLKLTTFNAGLAHTFVHHAKERIDPITEKLSKLDSDVVCIQEAWTKKDRKKIKKALKKSYPHLHMTKIEQMKAKHAPVCKIKELFGEGKFVSCMQKQCGGLDGDEFTDCIINTCGNQLRDLKVSNRECATSLMAQVGRSSLASMITLLTPFKRAGLFAYKGSNGLMLFSKKPMRETGLIDFSDISTLNRRQALTAQIDGKKVICTHLTADLEKTVPYTGTFKNWGEENKAQVQRMLKTIKNKDETILIMGDFNCSPEVSTFSIEPELPESCSLLTEAGFVDPATEGNNLECTSCASNLLNDEDSKNTAIDHIYVRGAEILNSKVVLKEKIKVETKRSNFVETNLSDHYGFWAEIE